jgi:annexin A13
MLLLHYTFYFYIYTYACSNRACSGLGTDDTAVISVICSRTKEHLKLVDKKYHVLCGKSLIQQIKGETSGYYEDLLVALVSHYDDFDANIIKKACDGKS